MTDEATISRLEQLVEDSIELAEENNKLLRSLIRTNRFAFAAKALMWIAVLVLPFIFLGPLIRNLIPASDTNKTGGLFGSTELLNIVNTYRASSTSK